MITLAQLTPGAKFTYTHEGKTYKLTFVRSEIPTTMLNAAPEYIFTITSVPTTSKTVSDSRRRFTISIGPGTLTSNIESSQFKILGDITAVPGLEFVGRGGFRSRTRSRKSRRRRHRSVRV